MLIPDHAKDEELDLNVGVSSAIEAQAPPKKDRISRASLNFDPNEDDYDPRFLHSMQSAEGADLDRKFFKNTTPEYLM